MFLQLSAQELVLGNRLEFTGLGRGIITRVVAAEPFGGQCPCCRRERVLTEAGRVVPGAEFDHFFHRGLNRPEHGWLICAACHAELTHGGYLVRFMRMPEFRAFQGAVLEHRRRERAAPGDSASLATPCSPQRKAGKSPMTSSEVMGLFAFPAWPPTNGGGFGPAVI